jgi:hypothetical protein
MVISWILGTCALWIPVSISLHHEGAFPAVFSEFTSVLYLLFGYACLSGLGFFAGGFTMYWLVVRVCRHINGAPFTEGDFVTVITGSRSGTEARVYEMIRGQGGNLLPRLDIGDEERTKYRDIFEDYNLLRHPVKGMKASTPIQ